jgi:hypothetical protein
MSEAIIVALITGACAIIAQALISRSSTRDLAARIDQQSRDADARLEKAQAVTDTKLDELTREVREHNNFARRMPVVEEQIKVANYRISDLERSKNHD